MFEIILSGKAPIYEQLYNGVAMLISSGRLAAGEKLPAEVTGMRYRQLSLFDDCNDPDRLACF